MGWCTEQGPTSQSSWVDDILSLLSWTDKKVGMGFQVQIPHITCRKGQRKKQFSSKGMGSVGSKNVKSA